MKKIALLFILLLAFTAAAYGLAVIDPNTIQCSYADGSIQVTPLDTAMTYEGAIAYSNLDGGYITTDRCVARLEASVSIRNKAVGTVIDCRDATGEIIYHGVAYNPTIVSGVWTWVEAVTGDRLISSASCTSVGVVLP